MAGHRALRLGIVVVRSKHLWPMIRQIGKRRPNGKLVPTSGSASMSDPRRTGDEAGEGVFLPMDRETTRHWEKAKHLFDEGHYSDAVAVVG